jgi:hypothetical protein
MLLELTKNNLPEFIFSPLAQEIFMVPWGMKPKL